MVAWTVTFVLNSPAATAKREMPRVMEHVVQPHRPHWTEQQARLALGSPHVPSPSSWHRLKFMCDLSSD